MWLTDAAGTKYRALPDGGEIPLDVLLRAGEAVGTTRRFDVPRKAGALKLIVGHEGFDMGWLIIGRSPFEKTAVRLE